MKEINTYSLKKGTKIKNIKKLMKTNVYKLSTLLVLLTLTFTSCELIIGAFLKDDVLGRKVELYTSEIIRLKGLYIHQYIDDPTKCTIYIFYANGSFKYLSFDSTSITNIENKLLNLNENSLLDTKTTNGAFWVVDSSKIEIRHWSPDNAYNRVYVQHIHLLNDTTFVTGKTWHIKNPENYYFHQDTFHFKELSFKPDSLFFEKGLDEKRYFNLSVFE